MLSYDLGGEKRVQYGSLSHECLESLAFLINVAYVRRGCVGSSIPRPVLSKSSLLAKISAKINEARFASAQYEE